LAAFSSRCAVRAALDEACVLDLPLLMPPLPRGEVTVRFQPGDVAHRLLAQLLVALEGVLGKLVAAGRPSARVSCAERVR
jgi:hypothetical protein